MLCLYNVDCSPRCQQRVRSFLRMRWLGSVQNTHCIKSQSVHIGVTSFEGDPRYQPTSRFGSFWCHKNMMFTCWSKGGCLSKLGALKNGWLPTKTPFGEPDKGNNMPTAVAKDNFGVPSNDTSQKAARPPTPQRAKHKNKEKQPSIDLKSFRRTQSAKE